MSNCSRDVTVSGTDLVLHGPGGADGRAATTTCCKKIPLRRKLACNWHTFAVLVLIGCGPLEQTPGFRLGGVATAAPESFAFMQDHPVIQLECQGALLPRVVNLWGVAFDGAIYVVGTPDLGWVQRVEARPKEVRVRVGDNAYELNATTVNDRELKQRVFTAFQAKYAGGSSFEYTVEDFESIFRLAPDTRPGRRSGALA